VIVGPAYVGPHSTVLERAVIRANTAIGPWCKVAGEVGGTIFQGYSNKAHDGYLGDSWVGEWVNLGAGTTNSNLLNTYAEVKARATPDGPEEPAGERFVGAFIGDHVKTAIGTRIMTGAVIGTGSMISRSAQVGGCLPGFSWSTDAGRDTYRLDRFIEAVRSVMARRNVEPSPAYLDRVAALHRGAGPGA
jgi:UDP-N-acetylglucosamine diphosphorylase/glucosamine-1-phosphate N-acetyltransferase